MVVSLLAGTSLLFPHRTYRHVIKTGDATQRRRARDYVQFVTQQRIGPVHINLDDGGRDDLTVVDVPEDCVGFVMGRGGNTLRSMEEEWGSLMFFAQVREPGQEEIEKLCIFGSVRSRRGAELKVSQPQCCCPDPPSITFVSLRPPGAVLLACSSSRPEAMR